MADSADQCTRHENADWPTPVTLCNERGSSEFVIVCEHASNYIPPSYKNLGLCESDLQRHIAYDLGAAQLAVAMSKRLDAPAFLGGYSRLLVDLNRPPGVPSSMPVLSEYTNIPGNENLQADEIERRLNAIFHSFHQQLSEFLAARRRAARNTTLIAVHSFSPIYAGEWRPFHVGILFERSATLALAMLRNLRRTPDIVAEANVPYQIHSDSDYTIPVHGTQTGIPALLIEIRNDGLSTSHGVESWSMRIVDALRSG